MPDMILKFRKSQSSPPALKYAIRWLKNGAPAGGGEVSAGARGDAEGYELRYSGFDGAAPLAVGDQVTVSVQAIDAQGQASAWVNVTETMPAQPPGPPLSVTLTPA